MVTKTSMLEQFRTEKCRPDWGGCHKSAPYFRGRRILTTSTTSISCVLISQEAVVTRADFSHSAVDLFAEGDWLFPSFRAKPKPGVFAYIALSPLDFLNPRSTETFFVTDSYCSIGCSACLWPFCHVGRMVRKDCAFSRRIYMEVISSAPTSSSWMLLMEYPSSAISIMDWSGKALAVGIGASDESPCRSVRVAIDHAKNHTMSVMLPNPSCITRSQGHSHNSSTRLTFRVRFFGSWMALLGAESHDFLCVLDHTNCD